MDDLRTIVNKIVTESVLLKNKYTNATNAPVEFACVFCQTDQEYKIYTGEIKKLGEVVQDTTTGFTYLFNIPLKTQAGPLSLVKIRRPDPLRKERGDADFNTNFNEFKNRYINESNFQLVKRDQFEMLRLSESGNEVMACFSNIPLSKILGLNFYNNGQNHGVFSEGFKDMFFTNFSN